MIRHFAHFLILEDIFFESDYIFKFIWVWLKSLDI